MTYTKHSMSVTNMRGTILWRNVQEQRVWHSTWFTKNNNGKWCTLSCLKWMVPFCHIPIYRDNSSKIRRGENSRNRWETVMKKKRKDHHGTGHC